MMGCREEVKRERGGEGLRRTGSDLLFSRYDSRLLISLLMAERAMLFVCLFRN